MNISYDEALHLRWSRYVAFAAFDECWNWTGATVTAKRNSISGRPYRWGVMSYKGKTYKASRVCWALNRWPITTEHVLHQCDNPLCVNPAHLFLGTPADNVADMDRKGRRVSAPRAGVAHPNAKLTEEQVEIARRHVGPATPLARLFGCTPEQIRNIRRGTQRRYG